MQSALVSPTLSQPLGHVSFDDDPVVFPEIFNEAVNFSVWQRELSVEIQRYAEYLARDHQHFSMLLVGGLPELQTELQSKLPEYDGKAAIMEDLLLISDMFQELFDLDEMGFRLAVLTSAMCPRFHVDRIPCRMLTTYCGPATQWCPQELATRDEKNWVQVEDVNAAQQLKIGDVALLKGDAWTDNEGKGIVHRSPPANKDTPRLVLTLDFI